MFLFYPAKRSNADPFLENLTRSIESQGGRVESLLSTWVFRRNTSTVILNWAENLWSNTPDTMARRVRNFAGARLLLFFLHIHLARGGKIVMIVHNLYPHGDSRGTTFWKAAHRLLRMADVFIHFTEASRALFRDDIGVPDQKSVVHAFPVDQDNSRPISDAQRGESTLLFVGVNQERKELHQLLNPNSRPVGFRILASGFENEAEFRHQYGFDIEVPASPIKWLGRHLSRHELEDALHKSSILVLNQPHQLNSGLMWMAISRGVRVVAPETPAFLELAAQLGPVWLHLFQVPLGRSDLQNRANDFLDIPHEPPPTLGSFCSLAKCIKALVGD